MRNQAVRLMLDEITRLQRDEITSEELTGTTHIFDGVITWRRKRVAPGRGISRRQN